MNKYEMIPTTYPELKILRVLVASSRDLLQVNGAKATLELESLKEKLDAAARRFKQGEYQRMRGGETKDIVIPQEIPSGMTQEDARKEITDLHHVLRHGDLRPDWSRRSLDGSSPGVFYDIGPVRTKGLTVVQYYELVRLAKAGLLAEGRAQ